MSFASKEVVVSVETHFWWTSSFLEDKNFRNQSDIILSKVYQFVKLLSHKYPGVSEDNGFKCQWEGFGLILENEDVSDSLISEINQFLSAIPELSSVH